MPQLCAACALMPLRPEGYRALGKLRAQLGRHADAAYDLALACRLAPDDPDARAALAEVDKRMKRERLLLLGAPALLVIVALGGAALLWLLR